MALNNVTIGLLIILILFIAITLIFEYIDYDPICSGGFHTPKTRKLRMKKLARLSAEGMVRGIVTGSITGGLGGATSYGIALGVVNPFMMIFLESLPAGTFFRGDF